jgi:hypothetical protein
MRIPCAGEAFTNLYTVFKIPSASAMSLVLGTCPFFSFSWQIIA